jgi:hypothetical protein
VVEVEGAVLPRVERELGGVAAGYAAEDDDVE